MYWQEKPFTYEVCVPPLSKPVEKLTHRETEAYFLWHLSVLEERIDYLSSQVCNKLSIPRSRMDLSAESLIPLWEWFLSALEVEETPKEALQEFWEKDKHPEPFRTERLNKRRKQFTLETECILFDVGKYLGEVFTKTVPGISWTYYEKPKSDFFVNMTVIQGFADFDFDPPFRMYFEPVHMAHVQAANIWDNTQKKDDLYRLYGLWSKKAIQLHSCSTEQTFNLGSIKSVREDNNK